MNIMLFHSTYGLRPAVRQAADRLREAGHEVWTPDLFEGRTFETVEELDGKLVGGVLTLNFDAEQGSCEVGCGLEPAATGRGLITRAMRILIDSVVEERGVHRVEWVAASGNTASINVAKRL